MQSQDDDSQQRFALGLIFILVALVVAMVLGLGINHRKLFSPPVVPTPGELAAGSGAGTAQPVPASIATASAAQDAASIRVEQGVVKFYFASGQAELATGAGAALAEMVKAAAAGRQLTVSGFHDASGDVAKNAELAKKRAQAVQAALKSAGVADNRISLKKPQQMTGSGSDAEARRVEITIE